MGQKVYRVYVQFESQEQIIPAKNAKEAKEKMRKKMLSKTAWSIADKRNLFVDEV